MQHNLAQVRELLTHYGPIDVIFFDGVADGLKELAWELQPEIVVTRGDLATPEQYIPDQGDDRPWEACFTLGTQWAYKPTNEVYKSGNELIRMLVETRAKGGNLLLNVGPKPNGEIPVEQEARIQEMALWIFTNQEAVYEVRPWSVLRERLTLAHEAWYLQSKGGDAVYAVITGDAWPKGERKVLRLEQVAATERSAVEILGQSGQVLEYRPEVDAKATWSQDEHALLI